MYEFLIKTYTIVLPVILSYIVWLLQEQKKKAKQDAIVRDERIKKEREMREANSKGTMLLLRVKLIEYHEKYMKRGQSLHMHMIISMKCMMHTMRSVVMVWLPK